MKFSYLCLIALSLSPLAAFADSPASYNCHVMLIASDMTNGSAEANYAAEAVGGSHGGAEHDFIFQNNKVGILADGKWLAISWERNGKLVATATTVRTEATQKSAVLIVADPANSEQQVSVDCTATP